MADLAAPLQRRTRWHGVTAICCQLALACGSPHGPTEAQRCQIVSGVPDATYSGVVALLGEGDVAGCTGTIIDHSRVLTAAHCIVDGAPPLRIRIERPESTFTLAASETLIHPRFEVGALGGDYQNDIAILSLPQPV